MQTLRLFYLLKENFREIITFAKLMLKKIIFLTFIVSGNHLCLNAQIAPAPEEYSLIDTVSGDLDKDGIKELVVAYNTRKDEKEIQEGVPRELIIYKKENGTWKIWKKSMQALLGSRDGGMMGDPFGKIEIKNGVLIISHNGGSSWKWGNIDKYRFQEGEFYLIGYTSTGGKPCEYWETVDFNLMTGKMIVKKEYEDCDTPNQEVYKRENETIIKKGLKISLQNRNEKEIKFVTPKYQHTIYVAIKHE